MRRAFVLWREVLIASGLFRPALLLCLALAPAVSPVGAQTHFAQLAPDGAWTWYNDPRALFHNGVLYFGYVRNDGKTALSAFDPVRGATTDLWASGFTQRDDHNNPGLLAKQDGTLLAIYARHNSDPTFSYRRSITTSPDTPDQWYPEQVIAPTGAGVSYSNPFQLAAEGGTIYNFMRDLNFNPTVTTSTDGGNSWSAPRLLIRNDGRRPYVKYCSDGADRIDFLYTDSHPRNSENDPVTGNSLYHMFYRNGAFYASDGTLIKTWANLPFQHASGERGTVVYQFNLAPAADPDDHIADARAWCVEIVRDAAGNPVCVFTVQVDGATWRDSRIFYYYARHEPGTGWRKRFIAQAGRPLYSSEADYPGGICLNPDNPDEVYLSSNAESPFDLDSVTSVPLRADQRYQLYRGLRDPAGGVFTWTQLTSTTTEDNLRPYMPRRAGANPAVIWFRGIYTSYTNFQTRIVGLFSQAVNQPPAALIERPPDPFVSLPNAQNLLLLQGAASDDGPASALAFNWKTIRGPAPAVFSAPTSATTAARFPQPGSYVLEFAVSDGYTTATDQVTVLAGTGDPLAPDPALTLWLRCDETSGTLAADSSGMGNTGTLAPGAGWQPVGVSGGALALSGTNSHVTVPDHPTLDPGAAFTLSWWFRVDGLPRDQGLVSKRNGPTDNNAFTTWLKSDGLIYVDIDGNGDRFTSTRAVTPGQWTHAALVFNGALPAPQRAQLWIDGILDRTAAESSAAIPDTTSSLLIGLPHPGSTSFLKGSMDEIRLYRRALGADEIAALGGRNRAPTVEAGYAGVPTAGIPLSLNGAVGDDGQGGPLTSLWSLVSGPGIAAITDPAATVTQAIFNKPGTYILRLAASDTRVETAAEIAIEVSAPNRAGPEWRWYDNNF